MYIGLSFYSEEQVVGFVLSGLQYVHLHDNLIRQTIQSWHVAWAGLNATCGCVRAFPDFDGQASQGALERGLP
jgi:hypothetical protein